MPQSKLTSNRNNRRKGSGTTEEDRWSEKYSSALKFAGDSIFITNIKGIIEYVNPAMENLTGYKQKEIIGKTPGIFNSGKQDKKFYQRLWKIILSGNIFRDIFINKKKNGDIFYVDHTITPVCGKGGEILYFIGIWKDVTEQKLLEKHRNQFFSIANHEIKTPLTSMKIFTEILQKILKDSPNRSVAEYLGKIDGQIDKMTSLVNTFLDFSRVRERIVVLNKERIRIDKLIETVVSDLQNVVGNHSLQLNISCRERIQVDEFRVSQVLTNLIVNAAKFSPRGRKVVISLIKSGNKVKISVKDYGKSIPAAVQAKIFEPFFSYKMSQSSSTANLGLGLYIARELISLHHGRIGVISRRGRGTVFYFTLPID